MSTWVQSFAPKVWGLVYNHSHTKSTDWWWFLLTYLMVGILTYSPRTGTRSKCLQIPWGVDLTLEPDHQKHLHDPVGFFFFTTTVTNRWIPTGITWRICTHSLRTGVHAAVGFPFLPRQANKYSRVLHTRVSFFPDHNIKGLLFPNQKRLGPFPKKAHTPSAWESDTGLSASSHMDA